MTDQTRYRIVCADGIDHYGEVEFDTPGTFEFLPPIGDACGPHTVEPVAPDPTCAQSSCIHCRNGKPGACPAPPYPGRVVR